MFELLASYSRSPGPQDYQLAASDHPVSQSVPTLHLPILYLPVGYHVLFDNADGVRVILTVTPNKEAIASKVSADIDCVGIIYDGKLNATGTSRSLVLSEDKMTAPGRVVLARDNLHEVASVGEAAIVV